MCPTVFWSPCYVWLILLPHQLLDDLPHPVPWNCVRKDWLRTWSFLLLIKGMSFMRTFILTFGHYLNFGERIFFLILNVELQYYSYKTVGLESQDNSQSWDPLSPPTIVLAFKRGSKHQIQHIHLQIFMIIYNFVCSSSALVSKYLNIIWSRCTGRVLNA